MSQKKIVKENNSSQFLSLFYFALLGFAAMGVQASSSLFNASVDRTTIAVGESLTLTLTYLGDTRDNPDLTGLEKDFSVTSQQSSHESVMINGRFKAKTVWILEIIPRSNDEALLIPAILFQGYRTEPISINQTKHAAKSHDNDVALTLTADKSEVYLNGEIILKLQLKTSLPIRNGSLSKLELKNCIIEQLLTDESQEIVERGIKYTVIEKSYAVYPTKTGTVTIPSMVFSGVVTTARKQYPWPDFFTRGQRITVRSDSLLIKVKDIPESYPKNVPFLPLKDLVVIETLDAQDKEFLVNKTFGRHFELKAKGAPSSFLPDIAKPVVENLSVYVEEGEKKQTNLEDGIEAYRKISHVYMPIRPGKIVVPEEIIYWWDTESDKLKTTVIRALDMDVEGIGPSNTSSEKQEDASQQQPTTNVAESNSWLIAVVVTIIGLFVVFLIYALVKLFILRRQKLVARNPQQYELLALKKQIQKLCAQRDIGGVYKKIQDLLTWTQKYGDATIAKELKAEILVIEELLFTKSSVHQESAVFERIKKKIKSFTIGEQTKSALVPLYPR